MDVDKHIRKSIEGIDYYWDDGLMVMTKAYLLKKGHCCESGCRHCPYGFKREGLNETI